jgi:hypothetical protein
VDRGERLEEGREVGEERRGVDFGSRHVGSVDPFEQQKGTPKKLGSPSDANTPGTGTAVPARQRSTLPSRSTSYGSKMPRSGWIRSTARSTGAFPSVSRQVTFDRPSVSGSTAST